ncbi:hypothetical protein KKH30_00585, partial [Candidatus Micrarchaeota archaeon]|nr:hypothetical protein [Candidatus Micrarchaeota archaeon]MBU1939240.1 hypothetical protein [Candidatus Micrarchaeota archaeon]
QFRKTGDVSFRAAAGTSWKRFIVVVPSVLVVEMGAFAISAALGSVIGIMIAFGSAEGTLIMGAVSLAAIFVMLVAFFLLYPVAALENLGIIATLRRTLSLSRGNLKDVVIASAASMAISLLSFLLAFGFEFALRAGNAAGVIVLVLFILARIFTGVFAAYLYVLNPTFYLEYGLGNAGIARGKGKALK